MKALLAILLIITLGGCATTPTEVGEEDVSTADVIIDALDVIYSVACLFDDEDCEEPVESE